MLSYFTPLQQVLLMAGTAAIAAALFLFDKGNKNASLLLLLTGALLAGLFVAALDPFLNIWDEQYHALVAKNLAMHPLKPTLYDTPIYDFDFRNWTGNNIWLHKQPLFLWQMAASIRIFGANEMAVRLPDVILHGLLSLIIYRTGRLTISGQAGFYAACFFAFAYYPLELTAGKFPTDHNDLSFLFYVTASVWSWLEYRASGKRRWLLLTGLFAGAAVLVKWLFGLLIFVIWTASLLRESFFIRFVPGKYLSLLAGISVSLLVFLPWQAYVFEKYPEEAAYEYRIAAAHWSEVVEDHDGGFLFHLNAAKKLYGAGDVIPVLLLAGILLLVRKASPDGRLAFPAIVLITYGFYSLASTKMASYTVVAMPVAFLGLGVLTDESLQWLFLKIGARKYAGLVKVILVTGVALLLLNLPRIRNYHTDWKPTDNFKREADMRQMRLIRQLKSDLSGEKAVVFNASERLNGHIPVMFYTDAVAYDFIPDLKQVERARALGYKVFIVDRGDLPLLLQENPENIIVRLR
jgi:4-amino-4-deoxy-L-arabinose transferase